MMEVVIAGMLSFAGTNVDDLFLNTLVFARSDTRGRIWSVIVGKYLGMGALVLFSLLGASVLHAIPQKWIGGLGLIPIALGVKEWGRSVKSKKQSALDKKTTPDLSGGIVFGVALITIANGGDNISVYMSLFSGYTSVQMLLSVAVFTVMTAVWCLLGKKLSDLPGLREFLLKYKGSIVPIVFVMLGVYIMAEALC